MTMLLSQGDFLCLAKGQNFVLFRYSKPSKGLVSLKFPYLKAAASLKIYPKESFKHEAPSMKSPLSELLFLLKNVSLYSEQAGTLENWS